MKKYDNKDLASITALSKFYKIPKSISTLLYNRGIDTEDNILKYFKKEYKLDNPLKFPTMKKALKRIKKALISDEKIVVFGDYDVDGMVATSMIYLYLLRANANVDFFIPDRKSDGYGFNDNTVKKMIEEYAPDLIISVDTGITAKKAVDDLKKANIDVIITDHHTVQLDKIPNAVAIINPKFITKDPNNLQGLSGGGVAFYFLRAINSTIFSEGKRQKMVDYLVLAMITIISDMMPLKGDNRMIVEHGLEYLFETNIVGLNLLLDNVNFFEYPNAMDVGQQLSPILNSAGRIGNPDWVISLLTDDTLNSFEKVKELMSNNKNRKDMTKKYYDEAKLMLKDSFNEELLILDDKDYNLGIIGLLATRFCYELEKPVLVLGGLGDDGKRKASMRSLSGIELTPLIDILGKNIEGGGHDFALGFSVEESKVDLVKSLIKDFMIGKKVGSISESEVDIEHKDIDDAFIKLLYSMEPFGKGNDRPIIKINNLKKIKDYKILKEEHFKIEIDDNISIICFFASKELFSKYNKIISEEHEFSIIGDTYSNGSKLKIFLKDIEFPA
jgi:single-stranded-DNA-specific exonuclease